MKYDIQTPFLAVDQKRRDRAVLEARDYMVDHADEPFCFVATGDMIVFAFWDGTDIEVYETTIRRQVTF